MRRCRRRRAEAVGRRARGTPRVRVVSVCGVHSQRRCRHLRGAWGCLEPHWLGRVRARRGSRCGRGSVVEDGR